MKPRWALVHDTFEGASPYPIVRHVFYGHSPSEVYRLLDIHKANDKFIAGCTDCQRFELLECRTQIRLERVQ